MWLLVSPFVNVIWHAPTHITIDESYWQWDFRKLISIYTVNDWCVFWLVALSYVLGSVEYWQGVLAHQVSGGKIIIWNYLISCAWFFFLCQFWLAALANDTPWNYRIGWQNCCMGFGKWAGSIGIISSLVNCPILCGKSLIGIVAL
jgi:hypothetical protein